MRGPEQHGAEAALQPTPDPNADGPTPSALRDAVWHLRLAAEVRHGINTSHQDVQLLIDERSRMQQEMHAVMVRIGRSIENLSGEDARQQHALMEASDTDAATSTSTMGSEVDVTALAGDEMQMNPAALAATAGLRASATPARTAMNIVASRQGAQKVTAGRRWKRLQVIADEPQDVSDDSDEPDEDDLTGTESSPGRSSKASASDGGYSSESGADSVGVLAPASSGQSWTSHKERGARIGELESSAAVQRLLAAIKIDARTRILEDLDLDFSQRQALLENESQELEDLEMNLQKENDQAEQTSSDLLQTLDQREANIYRVLQHYGHTVSELVAGKMPLEPLAPSSGSCAHNIEELRALRGNLLQQEKEADAGKSSMVKPAVILEAISAIQGDIDVLRRAVDVEVTRLQACEYAERELDRAVQSASDAPLSDPVVSQVVAEVRQVARLSSQDGRELEEDMFEHVARLTKEREWLRGEVQRQQSRACTIAAGVAEEDLPKHAAVCRKRRLRRASTRTMPACEQIGDSKIKSHPDTNSRLSPRALFGKDAQQEHERAIGILCDRAARFEQQILDIQDFKQQAANSVPVIEGSAHMFEEIIQQAKRNVQVGQLADEGERAERLLAELRNVNHELARKQEVEHAKEMQRLKSLEARFNDERAIIDERLVQLESAVIREEGQNNRIHENLERVALRTHNAVERLEKLEPLNMDEVQQEYAESLQTAEKMNNLLVEEKSTLKEALKSTSKTTRIYEHVRAAAAELLSNKAAVLLEQSTEEADNSWWSLAISSEAALSKEEEDGDHQEEEEMDAALKALSTKAAELLGEPAARKVRRCATFNPSSSVDHVSDGGVVGAVELLVRASKGGSNDILSATTRSEAIKRSLHGLVNSTKLLAQRQRHRLGQQLLAAEQDEREAIKLREKTDDLNSAAAAMEHKVIAALGFRNKKQLPEELQPRHGEAVVPQRVQALRQEVRAQKAELVSLSKRWHKISNAAQLALSSNEEDVVQEDLRQELEKLCGKTLRHRGQIYVRNKEKEQPNAV